MPDDTTQRGHRLAPQEPTPEASGRSIPPIRSDLVGAADTHLAAKPPARPILAYPPPPADRPVRAEVGACAVSKGVAAGYVWCRLSPPSFTDHRNRPGSPPATYRRQKPPPALPVNHIRCSADHRPPRRRDAGADVGRAVGVCLMGRTRAARGAPHLTSSAGPRHTASVRHPSGHRIAQERRCKVILKEPHARAA